MIKKFFRGPTDNASIQFLRYVFVGGAATVIDFGLLYLLTEYGKIYYLISTMISFTVSMIFNNLFSMNWVFSGRVAARKWLDFLVFTLIAVIGLGLNVLLMWIFTEPIHCYYLLSKVFATALVFLWNFIARKVFVLRTGSR
ncbi:MAG TPA: GtrA family protein [Firmicutes bacterium]|jgi:putative flippase GtrA|nr:GtrA family protein [Bacillota bacterium]